MWRAEERAVLWAGDIREDDDMTFVYYHIDGKWHTDTRELYLALRLYEISHISSQKNCQKKWKKKLNGGKQCVKGPVCVWCFSCLWLTLTAVFKLECVGIDENSAEFPFRLVPSMCVLWLLRNEEWRLTVGHYIMFSEDKKSSRHLFKVSDLLSMIYHGYVTIWLSKKIDERAFTTIESPHNGLFHWFLLQWCFQQCIFSCTNLSSQNYGLFQMNLPLKTLMKHLKMEVNFPKGWQTLAAQEIEESSETHVALQNFHSTAVWMMSPIKRKICLDGKAPL